MWWLEANIGSPYSNLEQVLIATAKEQGGQGGIDKEAWLKILQKQEAAHQLEFQKWHDLLGSAASLLKQVKFAPKLVNGSFKISIEYPERKLVIS